MAASGYTPISIYHSTTASAAPTSGNLVNGELAINITDGKLYYKDNGGTVQIIASKGTGTIGGSTTQVQYNLSGALAGSSNFVFDGTTATINTLNLTNALGATYGGTAQSSWTTGDLLYASGSNTLAKLGIGLNTYILTSNGSIPGWAAPSAISVNTATNLAGGAAGSVPYQSGPGATTFLSIGTANQVVTSTGSAPQWSSGLSITTLTASDAVTFSATTQNIALGTSQTSGTFTVGGTAQTGNIAIDRSTKTHTLNIGTGITESGQTKTINIGTAGDTGSTTAITIGSANGTTITVNGTIAASTLDLTNLEVTNIKAKDGTASMTLADTTGIITLSATAGTANGVLYLNGSRAVTSGSALTFDGTNLDLATVGAKVNFATTSSATRNYVGGAADGFSLEMVTQRGASQPLSYKQNYAVGHEWGIAGSIPMTLDASGNLLVGNTSFAILGRVSVSGNYYGLGEIGAYDASKQLIRTRMDSNVARLEATFFSGSGGGYVPLAFSTSDAERARIDASGTLILRQSSNAANTSVSFNTTVQNALTLDSSGNLLVGTTTLDNKVTLSSSSSGAAAGVLSLVNPNDATSTAADLEFVTHSSGTLATGRIRGLVGGADNYPMSFWTYGASGLTEKMRIAADGNVGIGETNPAAKLDVVGETRTGKYQNDPVLRVVSQNTGGPASTALGSLIFNVNANNIVGLTSERVAGIQVTSGADERYTNLGFWTSTVGGQASPRMLLDSSGNLGLGVTPSASWSSMRAFQNGTATFANDTGAPRGRLITNAVYNGSNYLFLDASSNYALNYTQDGATGAHQWRTSTAAGTSPNIATLSDLMTLDASGNLSLDGGGTYIVNNAKAYTAKDNGGTARYILYMSSGVSPSSGNDVILGNPLNNNLVLFTNNTERARITSGGDFLVGKTTTYGDEIAAFYESANASRYLYVENPNSGTSTAAIINANAGSGGDLRMAAYGTNHSTQANNASLFNHKLTGSLLLGTEGTERARITSGGNFVIGDTSTSSRFEVVAGTGAQFIGTFRTGDATAANNAGGGFYGISSATAATREATLWLDADAGNFTGLDYFYIQKFGNSGVVNIVNYSNAAMTFYTNAAERARITSGGDFLVGTTSGSDKIVVEQSTAASASLFINSSGTAGAQCVNAWHKNTTGDNVFLQFFTEASATSRGSISYDRTAGLVAYNTTSDYRAKDILGPVANSGATIDALKVYEGKMKGAAQSRPMLVAHEAQEHVPYAVTGEKDAVNADGTPKYQQMDVSSLVPLLLAEVQSLRARVAQLEAK